MKKIELLYNKYGFQRRDALFSLRTTVEEREEIYNAIVDAGYKVDGPFEPMSNYAFRTAKLIFAKTNVGVSYFKQKYNILSYNEFMVKLKPEDYVPVRSLEDAEKSKVFFGECNDNSNSYKDSNTSLDLQIANYLSTTLTSMHEKGF
jgi:hypothetical protein